IRANEWQGGNRDKRALLKANKRRLRFRLAWATLPILLAITAAIFWNSHEVQYQMGRWVYEDKSYEKAINYFTKAIERDPQCKDSYVFRGNAKSALGDKQGGIGDYNKALEIDPKYALAYNNRARAKYDLEDKQGAIADFNKALEIDPKFA